MLLRSGAAAFIPATIIMIQAVATRIGSKELTWSPLFMVIWSLYLRHLVCLGHPSTSHGFVEVHQGLEEDTLGLGVLKLGIEEAPFGIEDLDVAGVAIVKAQAGNMGIGL